MNEDLYGTTNVTLLRRVITYIYFILCIAILKKCEYFF